ncbi:hypothetical protein L1987_12444 [Smallanthus sonchifolius]|uniref:Uncharacterized protein n=1 Tax=Smallanthus sonchifolius TaxID=185202 RepID=A0ACB9JEM5_9ASTR|nr:hypothetical protein L1987_12444 [Smallanthus sonchifolius]
MASSEWPQLKLGSQGLVVSAQGLGCMGMSAFYGPPKPEPDMIKLIHHGIESGVTFLDTSDIYGPHTNEILIGKVGNEVLIGVELLISISMGELKKLVDEGKVKYVGLSEASASTIRRAHAVHPITAIQTKWSLWSRDLEDEIVPTCRHKVKQGNPRFQNVERNKTIFKQVNEMTTRKGCTAAQLALAWVHHQGNDVVPIPGTTNIENLNQNIGALSVKLTPAEMVELESFASNDVVKGKRHEYMHMTWMNSDTPSLSSWKELLLWKLKELCDVSFTLLEPYVVLDGVNKIVILLDVFNVFSKCQILDSCPDYMLKLLVMWKWISFSLSLQGANMPARAELLLGEEEKQMFHEVYDSVLYLGIIEMLQETQISIQLDMGESSSFIPSWNSVRLFIAGILQ